MTSTGDDAFDPLVSLLAAIDMVQANPVPPPTVEYISPTEYIRRQAQAADLDELDDGECPDCLPGSECGACSDDRRFHEDRDAQIEDQL